MDGGSVGTLCCHRRGSGCLPGRSRADSGAPRKAHRTSNFLLDAGKTRADPIIASDTSGSAEANDPIRTRRRRAFIQRQSRPRRQGSRRGERQPAPAGAPQEANRTSRRTTGQAQTRDKAAGNRGERSRLSAWLLRPDRRVSRHPPGRTAGETLEQVRMAGADQDQTTGFACCAHRAVAYAQQGYASKKCLERQRTARLHRPFLTFRHEAIALDSGRKPAAQTLTS